ncbi:MULTISPECIES: phosphotransferase [Nostocales]|uniref:Aminoglycoside phosphotransferase family protein n=3 Tax=Nostocales TaxID=1161 RepID=A0A8S9TDM2_9CYAN|nr:aminoglycoside phosphotransferase family protein [Tolypothrix bouteillei]KAF3890077.1 aminoglycoside phosphotransferase family protein [Tolypothrix bouteillei VB521301]
MHQDSTEQTAPVSLSEKPDRSVLTARAVAASIAVASAHGIRVEDPHVLHNTYSVRVHLRPAPVVARIGTIAPILRSPIESWLARELCVTEFLAAQGAPVVAPSDLLPPSPHEHDGFMMSFWRYVPPVSDTLPDPAIVGRMLADLHTVLRDYPGELPLLTPLNDIPRGLERLKQVGNILPESDLTLLQETYDRLLPELDNSVGSLQPLHGDSHAFNLIHTSEGILWNDFEDTCKGSIAWDLINLNDEGISAYPNAPDLGKLEPYHKMRQLHAVVWVYALLPELPDWVEPAKAILNNLRATEIADGKRS